MYVGCELRDGGWAVVGHRGKVLCSGLGESEALEVAEKINSNKMVVRLKNRGPRDVKYWLIEDQGKLSSKAHELIRAYEWRVAFWLGCKFSHREVAELIACCER